MSIEANITVNDHFFAGARYQIAFGPIAEDVALWTFTWALRAATRGLPKFRTQGATALVTKTSAVGGGIVVTGTYNATLSLNTQRVIVTIEGADTAALTGGPYVHALKRTDVAGVLAHGVVELLVPAVL